MRIFKYWVEHTKELDVGGIKQRSKAYGGSNISPDDALGEAIKKLKKAQKIIDGTVQKEENYEADIREEIIEIIDPENIVTRNRYGALILNSKHLMFVDIDHYEKGLLDYIFRSKLSHKELMLTRIQRVAEKRKYEHLGFRIYETFKGYRLIVSNESFVGNSKRSRLIMRDFKADLEYQWLCQKQNCYRARLTPKPYRMRQKGIRVTYPNRNPDQEIALSQWIEEYEQKSRRYATCRFIQQIGSIQSGQRIIDYHDRMTRIGSRDPLA